MSNFKRHMPSDTSLQAIHAALGRLWDAIEAQPSSGATTASPTRQLGATVSFSASPTSVSKHNDLLGIQGGDVDNYYHVTKIEYDGTGSGVLVRQTSPALLGIPTAPTAALGDKSTTLATTAFIKNQYTFLTMTPVSDVDYTVTSTNGLMIVYRSLTAARNVFLGPATGSGQIVQLQDATGLCSSALTLSLVANGTDTIELGPNKSINYPYGSITIEDSAAGKWVVSANPNPNLSTGMQVQPSFTDLGTGSCTIGTGTYALYTNPSGIGKIKSYVIPGNTFALTDGVMNYIVANYNSGSPAIQVITNLALINDTTIIRVFDIYRQGTILHVLEWDQLGDALANKIHTSIVNTQKQRPEPGGLGLGEAATQLITVGSGTVWTGAVPTILAAFNSSVNRLQFAYHVAGAWTFSIITQYNNTQYDDGTNLQTTPGGKYVVNFVYRSVGTDNECFIVLGNQAYGLGAAQVAQPPGNLPPVISSHCILIGRIIVSQGATTATQIDSAFYTMFTPTSAVDHNSLANLQGGAASQYYHLTSAEYTGTGTGNFVRQTSPSLLGSPTTPTQSVYDRTTLIANSSWVKGQKFAIGNPASTWDAFGDSVTVGVGASIPSNAYIPLIAAQNGWTVTNHAVSGSQAADQADAIYALNVTTASQSTYMIGTNDQRIYLGDTNKQDIFRKAHLAELAWLTIPNANKITGQGAGVTYTGTWVNTSAYGGTLGKNSTTNGSTATMTVYGKTVYLAYITLDGNAGQFTISIDGVLQGTYNTAALAAVATNLGRAYAPTLLRYPGLTEGPHTIVMTVTSATGVGNVYFDWASGSQGNRYIGGPNLWVGNVPRYSSAGYATYGGSDAIIAMYNSIIRNNVRDLSADGLNVSLVDSASRVNPSTDLYTDGLHPNDLGHGKIADAFLEGLNQIQKPVTMQPPISIESGTYTPVVFGGTTAGTNTYSQQEGYWVKTNGKVKLDIGISMTAKDAAMAGNIYISIPSQFSNINRYSAGYIGVITNTTLPAGTVQFGCYMEGSNNRIAVFGMSSGSGLSLLQPANLSNTSQFSLAIEFNLPQGTY